MGNRLYVGNLPYSTDEAALRALVEAGGERQVAEVRFITDRETGRPRGFAFVEVASEAEVRSAITALNGREYGGRTIVVSEAREPAGGGNGRSRATPRRQGGRGGGSRRGDSGE